MKATAQDEYGSPDRKHRRIVVTRHGGPDVLQVVEEDLPEPLAGEVRVRVLAAGVSAYDLMQRRSGSLPGTPQVPYTPGEDIVGEVDKLGEGVSTLERGQLVASYPRGGGYAEYVCLTAGELAPVPAGIDPAQAVCLVVNYLTAHMLLHPTAHVRSGERILVHGAAGGVGSALLELGKVAGLEMYGTASQHNHEIVSALGATPIDYRVEDFYDRIHTLTGDGVDAVFDPVGGARQIWRSYRTLRRGGRLVSFGMAAMSKAGVRVIPLSLLTVGLLKLVPDGKQVRMSPNLAEFAPAHLDWYCETLAELFDLVLAGRIKPVVAERIPLIEAARAHKIIERGGYAGKVVLVAENG
jgi:NADPH:quinone reductase-like Zn-dependent oxidoreductase